MTLDGVIQTWNAGSTRIYGLKAEEAIGQNFAILFTERDREEGAPEAERSKALTNGSTVDERWHQRGDGRVRYLTGITSLIRREGIPAGFVKVSRDFTPDKERERRIEAQTAAMQVLTEERSIGAAAPRFLGVLGEKLFWDAGALWLTDTKETLRLEGIWTNRERRLTPFEREMAQRTFRPGEGAAGEVLASGSPLWIADLRNAPKFMQGELYVRYGLRSVVLFPIVRGEETIGVCELFSCEIRERDQEFIVLSTAMGVILGYFAERERVERQLEDRNRAREYMLARVSHDLRAPLTTIRGWAQLLGVADIDQVTAGRMIEEASGVLQLLVDDLIDFARITAGKLRFDREVIDLPRFVDSIVEAAVPTATNAGVMLTTELETESCTVLGDRQRLRQIFDNLLSNALKFTPSGGRVTVKVENEDSQAIVRVRDTGRGITPDLLPHIFDRYKQADAAAEQAGLGLGLTIVAELVRLHGGTIEAGSEGDGRGATFTVRLPAAR
jgi:PAS domain S-box-containing protein